MNFVHAHNPASVPPLLIVCYSGLQEFFVGSPRTIIESAPVETATGSNIDRSWLVQFTFAVKILSLMGAQGKRVGTATGYGLSWPLTATPLPCRLPLTRECSSTNSQAAERQPALVL